MEYWRLIKGGFKCKYGFYWVSSLGRFKNGVGRILKFHPHKKGYLMVSLYRDGKEGRHQAHRLVGKAFIPNPDQLPQINHVDGNKKNNSISNLQWCTNLENIMHAWATGLRSRENYAHNGILTNEQVTSIRNATLRKGPYAILTRKSLAEQFGISEHMVKDIRTRRSYKHVL